jgi:DNA-binding transcriptional ArsR family regulator
VSEESEKQLLKEILRVLEEEKDLFVLANQEKLSQAKQGLLKEGTVKIQIYDLCDGTKTTQDISEAIKKAPEFVRSYLSTLRREGLIRTVGKDGKQVHEQIF